MFFFLIGAIAVSVVVLWRRLNYLAFLLGLLGWTVFASLVTLLGVFSCLYYSLSVPCPTLPLLSFPLRIEWSLIAYRCPNCVGYDIQIWLGGLWCWAGVSPALTGNVVQVSWLTQMVFPWLVWLAVFEALVVFGVVWGAKAAFPWFRRALVLVVV